MDTDCDTDFLQEEISVAVERTPLVNTSPVLPHKGNSDAGETQPGSTHHWNGMGGGAAAAHRSKGNDPTPLSRIEAAKRSLEKAMNGDSGERSIRGEEDYPSVSEVKMLREGSLTSSPSTHFKSSYAKSLADSYRRASIPVVVSSPKGQFYFKNDEFLSLSMRPVRCADNGHETFGSLSMNGDLRPSLVQNYEPQSLPPILDSPQLQKRDRENENRKEKSCNSFLSVYERLLDKDVFISYEQLQQIQEEQGGDALTPEDWDNQGLVTTVDGKKLVKLSNIKALLRQEKQQVKTLNGHLFDAGSVKDSQVESLLVERGQLQDRVDHLCRVMADRDSTIQQLEEDLLRVRMECQRLMVDNRSLRSSVGASPTTDSPSQVSQLQQQVQLLTAQLNKAEQSRHTYEAATRQLVDFLHTVNSTLNNASHLCSSGSPSSSLHSTSSSTNTKNSFTTHTEPDDDPPYRLHRPTTPPSESPASHPTPRQARRNGEAMKKSGSVWVLPTHNHNHRKVSRAASTHCVASAVASSQNEPTPAAATVTSPGSERTRPLTTDFLATRARELLLSLKSLMRSDSILKLNMEPKKSGSSSNTGKGRSSTSKSTKVENTTTEADTEPPAKTPTIIENPQNSVTDGCMRPTTLTLPGGVGGRERSTNETNASPSVSQNPEAATRPKTPPPRIGTGKTREDTLLPQSSAVNGNPQPLSLMVVGDHPCTSGDNNNRFSSLPLRSHLTRTLTDADQRLVWV